MSEIFFNSSQPKADMLQTQIDSFQTTLASLNQQVITLQETLQERDQEIAELELELVQSNQAVMRVADDSGISAKVQTDETLTIVGIIINLVRSLVWPRKDVPAEPA